MVASAIVGVCTWELLQRMSVPVLFTLHAHHLCLGVPVHAQGRCVGPHMHAWELLMRRFEGRPCTLLVSPPEDFKPWQLCLHGVLIGAQAAHSWVSWDRRNTEQPESGGLRQAGSYLLGPTLWRHSVHLSQLSVLIVSTCAAMWSVEHARRTTLMLGSALGPFKAGHTHSVRPGIKAKRHTRAQQRRAASC